MGAGSILTGLWILPQCLTFFLQAPELVYWFLNVPCLLLRYLSTTIWTFILLSSSSVSERLMLSPAQEGLSLPPAWSFQDGTMMMISPQDKGLSLLCPLGFLMVVEGFTRRYGGLSPLRSESSPIMKGWMLYPNGGLSLSYYSSGIKWRFGCAFCNICLFLLAMNRSGSTVFLMVIALDRYMRVVHPHHRINSLRISKAWCGALALWLITICMTTHVFTLKHVNTTYCESFMINTEPGHKLTWHKFEFIFSFYLPLLVILYCTIHIVVVLRGRHLAKDGKSQRALCFLTVVAALFIFCFLPNNIMQLLIWIKTKKVHCPALEDLTTAFYISISLTYLNSALDPLVYYFSSSAVKSSCRKALHLPQADTAESTERKTRETGSQSLSQLAHRESIEGIIEMEAVR